MKQSIEYAAIKRILKSKNNIKYFHSILRDNKIDYKYFKLNNLPTSILYKLFEIKKIKISRYIEQLYLNGGFDGFRLKELLLYNRENTYTYITLDIIFYYRNLPLEIYQDILYRYPKTFKNISSNTKNYNEIKEFYNFLNI